MEREEGMEGKREERERVQESKHVSYKRVEIRMGLTI